MATGKTPRLWGKRRGTSITGAERPAQGEKGQLRDTRYFTESEVENIIDCAKSRGDEVYVTMVIGFVTGCRVGELVRMTVSDWKFERGLVEITDSKKKRKRIVPVPEQYLGIIREYISQHNLKGDQLLCPMSPKTYNRWLKQIALEIGLQWSPERENIRWHSWRGTFVRLKHRAGYDVKWLEQAIGDTYSTILQYYSRYTDEDMVEIMKEKENND